MKPKYILHCLKHAALPHNSSIIVCVDRSILAITKQSAGTVYPEAIPIERREWQKKFSSLLVPQFSYPWVEEIPPAMTEQLFIISLDSDDTTFAGIFGRADIIPAQDV